MTQVRAQLVRDHGRQRLGRRQLHALGDLGRADLERAGEDAGEGEHVVDLVRVVAAARRDDRRVLAAESGWISGFGLAMAKMKEPFAIVATAGSGTVPPLTPMKTSAPSIADSSEPVRPALLVKPASSRLTLGQVIAVRGDDALAVADDDVPDAGLHEDLGDGDAGRARPGDDRAQLAERPVR